MALLKQGFIHIYTGHGKGKTTAALGLALRAAGQGLRTYIGQFMKGRPYGELMALRDHPLITIEQFGRSECLHREQVTATDVDRARHGLARARSILMGGQYDLVILDEINVALWFGLLSLDEVMSLLDRRPEQVELVLTGRYAPPALIARANLVTEMREVKHYYRQGISARQGIEY
jgi:cob(I)alamin adenosyltransferase